MVDLFSHTISSLKFIFDSPLARSILGRLSSALVTGKAFCAGSQWSARSVIEKDIVWDDQIHYAALRQ